MKHWITLLALAACGDDGPTNLVQTQDEPPGQHCEAGGVAIERGTDRDGDGVLAGSEIESREYVCGPRMLVREDPIAPGATCRDGGVAVHSGHDLDDDGILDDDEIEQTTTVCDPSTIWHGDLLTSRADDRAALQEVRVITGSLITTSEIGGVQAPQLELVGGALVVRTSTIVELPSLARVGGAVALEEGTLLAPQLAAVGGDLTTALQARSVAVPVLATIGGDVSLDGTAVTSLLVPALATIGGDVEVRRTALGALALPNLVEIGGALELRDCGLTGLGAPLLAAVGGEIVVTHCSGLTTLSLPAIEIVEPTLDLGDLPALASLDLGVTNANRIFIHDIGVAQLTLPRLVVASTISINDMPALTQIALPALQTVEQLLVGASISEVSQPLLTSLRAPQLGAVDRLQIDNSPQLVELQLEPPSSIPTIAFRNVGLADLSSLHGTRTIGSLYVAQCAHLTALGLAPLSLGALQLRDNQVLASLAGLENIHGLASLDLSLLPALTSLAGLHNVLAVAGGVEISKNIGLANLSALASLSAIGGGLRLRFNPALTSIGGLSGLTQLGGELLVLENLLVPPAEIEALRIRLGK